MFKNNFHVLALEIENKSKIDNLFIYFQGTDYFFLNIHRQFIYFAKSLDILYMQYFHCLKKLANPFVLGFYLTIGCMFTLYIKNTFSGEVSGSC